MIKEEFEALPENMQKYYNYHEQMGRLNKAINAGFYLEAIFIEYAVMEDRLQSILQTAGVFNPEKHQNIGKKINRIKELVKNPKHPAHKYISEELLESVRGWKDKRNPYIHELMKAHLTTEGLKDFALEGRELVKKLNSKSTSYRRFNERSAEK